MRVLRRLQGDTIYRADHGTEVASHATLFTVRIAGEDNAASPAWREISLPVGILDSHALAKGMQENTP
jgi:hypothetical protein